jgi:hypothetical protein
MFFTPYKGRAAEIGLKVDVYRNLHTNNGYSIRCSKTNLVLAHCSTVHLKNAVFHVSESGRQKTVKEKRKRVHAFVRGELVAYNVQIPRDFVTVLYNPYHTHTYETEKKDKNNNSTITAILLITDNKFDDSIQITIKTTCLLWYRRRLAVSKKVV